MRQINLFELDLTIAEQQAVLEVLSGGWLTQGPTVVKFETLFAERYSTHAVAVNSCTAALHLAHIVGGVGAGQEVIVPSMTFVATPNSVSYTGARVVFADIKSPEDWTICCDDIQKKITEKTSCVTPMHFAGYPADISEIARICRGNKLFLIEDACHALGSSVDGKQLGTFGDIGCFSFYGNKIMTTAEGGMMLIKNSDHADLARSLRSHGMSNVAWDRIKGALSYEVEFLGYNYRMDEIRAALGIVQYQRLSQFIKRRTHLVELYSDKLKNCNNISLPFMQSKVNQSNYIFPILLKSGSRDLFREKLHQSGIQTSVHYKPCHHFACYKKDSLSLPVTDYVAEKCVSLPLFPGMTDEDIDYICQKIYDFSGAI